MDSFETLRPSDASQEHCVLGSLFDNKYIGETGQAQGGNKSDCLTSQLPVSITRMILVSKALLDMILVDILVPKSDFVGAEDMGAAEIGDFNFG